LDKEKIIKGKNLSILIAEDDELSFLYLNIILKKFAKDIIRAKDGEEAIELVKAQKFDIILLDVNLPKISGLEVASEIHKKFPEMGIIMNSAFSPEDEREYTLDKGNFEYLDKPLKKEKVIDAIDKVLHFSNDN
jgi:CheY-like chemotaxis protein